METEDRWKKLEEIVRRVVREEITALQGKKPKLQFVNGKWTGLTDEQIQVWKSAYPAIDVDREISKAAAWIVSNPQDAPRSNFARFLNSWMERNQNRAAIRAIPIDKRQWAGDQETPTCAYCDQRASGTVNGIRHCRAHLHDALDQKPREPRQVSA